MIHTHRFIAMILLTATFAAFAFDKATASNGYQDWYPRSISPPAGHQYPCALTALPKDMTGIPEADRQFINHVYAMLLKCLEAKLVMIDTIMQDHQAYAGAYSRYYADTVAARQKIVSEKVPPGLVDFRNSVVNAIDLQIKFFGLAVKARQAGQSAQQVLKISEGAQASSLLQQAWGTMSSRYPSMSSAVKDSAYHHLCALDLF
jgi:hypothetical protein